MVESDLHGVLSFHSVEVRMRKPLIETDLETRKQYAKYVIKFVIEFKEELKKHAKSVRDAMPIDFSDSEDIPF